MADDVHETLQQHAEQLAEHSQQLAEIRESRKNTERLLKQHDEDIDAIRGLLPSMATKNDVREISEKIDTSINGLLRDALNAVPLKHANVIAIIAAGALFLGVAVALFHGYYAPH